MSKFMCNDIPHYVNDNHVVMVRYYPLGNSWVVWVETLHKILSFKFDTEKEAKEVYDILALDKEN